MAYTEKNRSTAIKGLSSSEAKKSFELYGNNHITVKKQKSFFRRYIDNFTDPIIRVLLVSLFLHVLFSWGNIDWFETGGILVAIFLSTAVSTISEHGSERAFAKMQNSAKDSKCFVMRDETMQSISVDALVRGDVVVLSAGQTVPADGVLLDGKIYVDQSALNGESEEVEKCLLRTQEEFCFTQNLSQSNLLFRGSVVLAGECKIRVERCGNETLYGQIANELQEDTRESPLRLRLNHLAKQISIFGYASAIIVALIYMFNAIVIANHYQSALILATIKNFKLLFPILLQAFTLAITIVVVSVPEGLPMMVAVVLSSNMKRMLKDQVLVKKMVG
ncbi:MAG: HAD-IC family P-type ATPase, partial [Clostridia bacterium]|nr:HAD-IC family P-type ATPase [Clostridia bacterium]